MNRKEEKEPNKQPGILQDINPAAQKRHGGCQVNGPKVAEFLDR